MGSCGHTSITPVVVSGQLSTSAHRISPARLISLPNPCTRSRHSRCLASTRDAVAACSVSAAGHSFRIVSTLCVTDFATPLRKKNQTATWKAFIVYRLLTSTARQIGTFFSRATTSFSISDSLSVRSGKLLDREWEKCQHYGYSTPSGFSLPNPIHNSNAVQASEA